MSSFESVADFVAIPRVSQLRLAPDGRRLVATVSTLSRDAKSFTSSLWEIDPRGAAPARRLTFSARSDSAPEFLPDGSVLFLSKRPDDAADDEGDTSADKQSVWLLPAAGGEARRVAGRPGGVNALAVAAESGTVVMSTPTMPGAATAGDDQRLRKARDDKDVKAILHEVSPVRYWDADLGPAQLRLLAAAPPATVDGDLDAPRDLTPQPGRALDEQRFVVTPDGSTVVTGWAVPDEPGYPRAALVAVDVATGARRVLGNERYVFYADPALSPDGRRVACVRTVDGTYDDPPQRALWLVELATGDARDLAPGADLWPDAPVFSADGNAVFFTSDEQGRHPVFRVEVSTGAVTRVANDGHYTDLCVARDGSVLYALRDRIDAPPTPVRLDPDGVDQAGEPLPAPGQVAVPGRVEELTATTSDGTSVRSWLVLPDGAAPATPAPLLLWVHGGPLSSWNAWSWRWNPWLMAARGYAVVLPDPALSTGYGEKMLRRGWGQWGGAPYDDVMAVTDAVVARPDIDESRTAAMGGSYGGYMANWIAGQTDRFRCIVTHASLWSLEAFVGTTDAPAFWVREWGSPDVRPERYQRWSPDRFADRISTPMLVIHGDKDYRVPVSEGLALWWALQRRRIESKFLYFPNENHWVLKPGGAQVWYDTVHAWLATHVLGRDWERPALV